MWAPNPQSPHATVTSFGDVLSNLPVAGAICLSNGGSRGSTNRRENLLVRKQGLFPSRLNKNSVLSFSKFLRRGLPFILVIHLIFFRAVYVGTVFRPRFLPFIFCHTLILNEKNKNYAVNKRLAVAAG